MLYVGEGSEREQWHLLHSLLSARFQQLLWLPTIKFGPSVADSWVGRFVYILGPVDLSNELSSEAGSFSCCLNLYRCFQSVVWDFISLCWNSGLRGFWPGLPLLPVWMNVSSLTPWLSDFHTVRFSVNSGCFFVFKVFVSFFWLYKKAQCVYLRLHLGQKSSLY